jgi:hypothetical protein
MKTYDVNQNNYAAVARELQLSDQCAAALKQVIDDDGAETMIRHNFSVPGFDDDGYMIVLAAGPAFVSFGGDEVIGEWYPDLDMARLDDEDKDGQVWWVTPNGSIWAMPHDRFPCHQAF